MPQPRLHRIPESQFRGEPGQGQGSRMITYPTSASDSDSPEDSPIQLGLEDLDEEVDPMHAWLTEFRNLRVQDTPTPRRQLLNEALAAASAPPPAPISNLKVVDFIIDHFLGTEQHCTCGSTPRQDSKVFTDIVDFELPVNTLVDTINNLEVLEFMSGTADFDRKWLYEGSFLETEDGTHRQAYDVWPANVLASNPQAANNAEITVDVDSFLALPKSLAFVLKGIDMCFCPPRTANLSSNIHLWCTVNVENANGAVKHIKVPYHHVPNTYLGRVNGFSECEVFVFFPHLYYPERPTTFLTDNQLQRFCNLFLQAIHETKEFGRAFQQHLPSSFEQAHAMSYARSRETGVNEAAAIPKQQALHYFLPARGLEQVWTSVSQAIHGGGNFDLADPVLLVSSKNMKTMYREHNLESLITGFYSTWKTVFKPDAFYPHSTWIDIGKETVSIAEEPETYLWRTTCLEAKREAFKMDVPRSGMRGAMYNWAQLADVGNMTLEPGRKHPLLACGLVYSQFYSSTKEIFDAAKAYPFQDKIIEGLAIDASLQEEWKRLGNMPANSWSAKKARLAYVSSKARVGHSLSSSIGKTYGIREEHRMTLDLVLVLNERMGQRGLNGTRVTQPGSASTPASHPPFVILSTSSALKYLNQNIQKYILGFEYSILKDGGKVISPDSSQMALMFLELIRSSFNASNMKMVKGMWNTSKLLPDGTTRYGLGLGASLQETGYAFINEDRVDWASWALLDGVKDHIAIGLRHKLQNFTKSYTQATTALTFDKTATQLCLYLVTIFHKQGFTEYTTRCLQIVWKWMCEHFIWEFQKEVLQACANDMIEDKADTEWTPSNPVFVYSELDKLMEEEIQLVQSTSNGRQAPKTIQQRLSHLFAYDGQITGSQEEKMECKWDKKFYRLRYKKGVEIWNHHLAQFDFNFHWSNVEFFKYFVRRCTLWPNSTTQKWFPLKNIPGRSDLGKCYVWCGLSRHGHMAFFPETWTLTNDPRKVFTKAIPLDEQWLTLKVDAVRQMMEDCENGATSWRDMNEEYAWTWLTSLPYTGSIVSRSGVVENSIMEPMWEQCGTKE
ncbi:hypothetical protein DFH27DRAFT_365363 [Peziza echinospora]|nr:hypothetical protein DFH27DRAFT_365363 [Peziza echinospora]